MRHTSPWRPASGGKSAAKFDGRSRFQPFWRVGPFGLFEEGGGRFRRRSRRDCGEVVGAFLDEVLHPARPPRPGWWAARPEGAAAPGAVRRGAENASDKHRAVYCRRRGGQGTPDGFPRGPRAVPQRPDRDPRLGSLTPSALPAKRCISTRRFQRSGKNCSISATRSFPT